MFETATSKRSKEGTEFTPNVASGKSATGKLSRVAHGFALLYKITNLGVSPTSECSNEMLASINQFIAGRAEAIPSAGVNLR